MSTDHVQEGLDAVERELGLRGSIESAQGLDAVQDLADVVADRVGPSVAARTAHLIGAAAGSAQEPPVAAHDVTEKVSALARSGNADTERAVPPNERP